MFTIGRLLRVGENMINSRADRLQSADSVEKHHQETADHWPIELSQPHFPGLRTTITLDNGFIRLFI